MTTTVANVPFWTAESKVPRQYPYVSEDIDCEVAVVGGGISGALCAYQLQKAGIDTVLAESGLFGYSGTGSSPSIMQYDFDYELSGLKDVIGLDKAVRAYRACARGIDEIECTVNELGENPGFCRKDSLYFTPDEYRAENVKHEYLLRMHNEFPVEYINGEKAADMFSFRIGGGIYTSGMAGEINPYLFAHALIASGTGIGLRAFENTSVEIITPDFDGITLQTKSGYNIHAKKMVNATGTFASRNMGRLVQKKTTFCVVTAPVDCFDGWHERCIIRCNDPYIYLRTLPDNRILIGGLDSAYIDDSGKAAGFIDMPVSVQRKYGCLEQKLISMMTGIGGITPEYRFSETSFDTGDGLPYVGTRSGYPNVYYDICTGSNGIVFAQLAADIIRDLYLGGDAADMDLMSFGRLDF